MKEDPHEITNLAENPSPKHRQVLERMRDALGEWRGMVSDAEIGERQSQEQLKESGWPDGVPPKTGAPMFVPNAPENREEDPVAGAVTLTAPATVRSNSPTQGASIAYQVDDEQDHWSLASGYIELPEGVTSIRAGAVRYGHLPSEASTTTFTVLPSGDSSASTYLVDIDS